MGWLSNLSTVKKKIEMRSDNECADLRNLIVKLNKGDKSKNEWF